MKKKIVFLGTKEIGYYCLKRLIEGKFDAEVVAVLTNDRSLSGSKIAIPELCYSHGIPILDHPDDMAELKEIDLIISVQYHLILKQHHIDLAKDIAVNLHMAPLPEYRGCNQFSFALIEERKEFGTTFHKLESSIDGGPIIAERRFEIPEECFVNELYNLTFDMTKMLFEDEIQNIIDGSFKLIPQSQLESKKGTAIHYRNEMNEIKKLNASWEKEKLKRYFRATYFPPFPAPSLMVEGKEVLCSMDWYNSL